MTDYVTYYNFISISSNIPFRIFSKVIDFQLKCPDINLSKISLNKRIVRINDRIDVIDFTVTDGFNNYTYYKKSCWKEVKLNAFIKL